MKHKALWLGLAAGILTLLGDEKGMVRQPVLVELFTSEGCSSCPPADAFLEKLDRTQPVAGAQAIVLSEHVDYWNHDGWTDPYSSAAYSARQEVYARRFKLGEGPYTPEMVVDGTTEFVGSEEGKAESAIRAAAQEPKVGVHLIAADQSVIVEVDALPAGTSHKANVYVAQAADSGTSDVLRGENKGRKLHHVSIAKDLRQVGTISDHGGFKKKLALPAFGAAGARLIAFVQEPGNGKVWGAAMYAVAK